MTLKAYSIRDAKGEMYNAPFFKKTPGEAERDFQTLVNNKETLVGMYPEDFDLYYLGEFNDQDGKLSILDTPRHIAKGIDKMMV